MRNDGLWQQMVQEVEADPARSEKLLGIRDAIQEQLVVAYRDLYELILDGSDDPGRILGAMSMSQNVLHQATDKARTQVVDELGPLFPSPEPVADAYVDHQGRAFRPGGKG